MAQDIDHVSVRVAKKEATDSPRLVGQRVDDLRAGTNGSCVAGVHVIDLNGCGWDDRGGLVVRHQAARRAVPGRPR